MPTQPCTATAFCLDPSPPTRIQTFLTLLLLDKTTEVTLDIEIQVHVQNATTISELYLNPVCYSIFSFTVVFCVYY